MQKLILSSGVLFGALAVILGAFGAHALKSKISPEQLQVFETGIRYQFYHALALLVLGSLYGKIAISPSNYAGYLFIAGIILFSGSIYLLSTREILGIDSWKTFLGPITPVGGLCLISGWIFFFISILKTKF